MSETYTINADQVLTLLNQAKQKGAAVTIDGKLGEGTVEKEGVQFGIGLISARHSRINRNSVTGLHTVVDIGEREYHTIDLSSEVPPYELKIEYSLEKEYRGGIAGVLWDVGKAMLHMRKD